MKALRLTDDYVEVAAVPTGGMVELYVTAPGSSAALQAHIPEKLAWRLGLWLLFWYFRDRLLGWRARQEEKRHRKLLLSLEEDENRD